MRKTVKKADNVRFGRPPPPKRVKSRHLLSEKSVNRDKYDFATKQRMFGVMAIVEILNYRGLPIPDPTH